MSEMSAFLEKWSVWYPKVPPIGFLLRLEYPERWMRIHSLPDSRRYPTSETDQAELLMRHNTVACDLLREDETCALFVYNEAGSESWRDVEARIGLPGQGLHDLGLLPSWLWEDDERSQFDCPMTLRGAMVQWRSGAFNSFILAVANEEIRGLVVEYGTGQVYAPYDGGADLFFASETGRAFAQRRYSGWLSDRPDSL